MTLVGGLSAAAAAMAGLAVLAALAALAVAVGGGAVGVERVVLAVAAQPRTLDSRELTAVAKSSAGARE